LSGTLAATWHTSGTHTYSWNTTAYADGTYKITLNVQDKASNLATTEVTVTVDNTVPLAEIREPGDQEFLGGAFNVTTWIYDTNINAVQLQVNGSVIDTWNLNGLHVSAWNTTTSPDGMYVIKLIVYDTALNSMDETVSITLDNTPPSVNMTTPTSGAEVHGDVTVQFGASDEHLSSVLLHVDNTILDVTGQTSHAWDTTQLGDGSHTIKLMAYDMTGNSAETSMSVITVNVRRAEEFTRSMYLAIGTPLGFIIGAIVAYAFTKRRFPA